MTAIFKADQAARRDWATNGRGTIPEEDAERRAQTQRLLDNGELRSGDDFYHAAFVFQHGDQPSDFLKAHSLAVIAAARGKVSATWIAAATFDRYLQSIGQPQIYGTQFFVLKTSRFKDEEAEGVIEALDEAGTELRDLVWVQESYKARILRDGSYPVLRGTFVDLHGNGLLYTSGSMPYYATYPGQYDPNPLLLCPHPSSESTITQLAEEIFSLTKVNWNSTQMNQRLPIPVRAARKVGEVLKYVAPGDAVSADYRKYI